MTRHADIVTVSRDSESFLSGKGVLFENVPEELLEASQSFLAMDPPRHTMIRKVVHAAFTPRQVRRIEDSIKANAQDIVAELRDAGSGADFVELCAKELPIRTLSDMVGIPESERQQVAHAADAMVSLGDPVFLDGRNPIEVLVGSQMYLHQVAGALAADRRENPGDDLISSLVHAEVDGDRLTDAEVAAFFVLLSVAGNDTTRQTMSHAVKALTDFGDQRAWLAADFDDRIGGAVEEFVRWATPVMTFRRTAATDCVLGDQAIAAGEKVVMFYASGNFDTDVFDAPGSARSRPQAQSAPRLRWRWTALLPRRARGEGPVAGDLRRAAHAAARHRGRRAGLHRGQLHPRHPLHAGHLLAQRRSRGVRRRAAPAARSSRRRP